MRVGKALDKKAGDLATAQGVGYARARVFAEEAREDGADKAQVAKAGERADRLFENIRALERLAFRGRLLAVPPDKRNTVYAQDYGKASAAVADKEREIFGAYKGQSKQTDNKQGHNMKTNYLHRLARHLFGAKRVNYACSGQKS